MSASLRSRLSFRAVNRKGTPGYDPTLQRHRLLPFQLLGRRCFARLFAAIGRDRVGFDDFRANGMLLPAREEAVVRMALPLHRGPHRDYNRMVIERVGQVEAGWSRRAPRRPNAAAGEAIMRLQLIQRALRRRLLDPPGERLVLNGRDPLGTGFDFTELDAMVERLWSATQPALSPSNADFAA